MATLLQPVKSTSLKDKVFTSLREAILSGGFEPGEALREAHVARDLGVSQVTVRDALVELEHLGLVVRVPNKATIITRLTQKEVLERLAIRIRLEEMAWIEAAERMGEAEFNRLESLLAELSGFIRENSHFEAAQADYRFHQQIWIYSGNEMLEKMLTQLTLPLFAFISIKRRRQGDELQAVTDSHTAIIDALRSRSPERITRVLHQHLERVRTLPERV